MSAQNIQVFEGGLLFSENSKFHSVTLNNSLSASHNNWGRPLAHLVAR